VDDERAMPFWNHLLELRNRLLVILAFVLLFSILGYLIFPYLYDGVSVLLHENLYAVNVTEGFSMRISIALFVGVVLSLPVLTFEAVLFLLPALKRSEKATLISLLGAALLLFVGGMAFAFKSVLPVGLAFLRTDEFFPAGLYRMMSYRSFFSFVSQFMLGFGICFQFPVVLIFLMKLGILKVSGLIKSFKYVLVLILVVSAVLTPSSDVVSQVMLAVPMTVLYAICIVVAKAFRIGA
jgi:sec-independent protein translocase protein TatC